MRGGKESDKVKRRGGQEAASCRHGGGERGMESMEITLDAVVYS